MADQLATNEAADDARRRALVSVWNDHPDEHYRRDLSHWQGHGRFVDEGWTQLVDTTARRVKDLYRTAGRRIESERPVAMDWGTGGGAGLVAVAEFCERLFAVDVSQKNLREAQRQLDLLETERPKMIPLLVGADPTVIATQVDRPIDLFVSVSTFHLFPTKHLGEEVLRTAFAIMSPGGLGYTTIRYDDGTPKYSPRQGYDRYQADHIFASSWGIAEFWALLQSIGFTAMKVANFNLDARFCSFFFKK